MISYNVETITPSGAMKILEGNTHNRKIYQHHVDWLAGNMKRGEWDLNGESIKLNGKNLLDGQHRLWACVEADHAFPTLIIRGLPKYTQKTIDTGLVRSGAHHFQMEGESYASLLSQTISKILAHAEGRSQMRDGISNIRLENYLKENPDIREFVNHHGSLGQKIVPKSIAAACHFIFTRIEEKEADEFMLEVIDGVGLQPEAPTLVLRERLIRDLTAVRKIPVSVKFALLLKAWNLKRKGTKCKILRFRTGDKPEPFPKAI